jgi:hypothetical protein
MTPAEFEDRLHDLLDARQDPLADAQCIAFLADHPNHLATFARQRERLAALPPIAARPSRRVWPWLLAVAAAAALVAVGLRPSPTHAAPTAAGRVLSASLQPIRPMLGVAATVRARTVLLAEPEAHLEVFAQWSIR